MNAVASDQPDSALVGDPRIARQSIVIMAMLIGLILCGIFRSALATRLDSFHLDEAYHITAGITYVRLGDYRLNPEHPPLVKLWVGSFLPSRIFRTPQLRKLEDKFDERTFTEVTVFQKNDPDLVQRRTRIASFLLNGMCLLGFALSVWRAFRGKLGAVMALGSLTLLVIDPTVAAHLPVVLTDLPVALLSSTALLLAWSAFKWGRTMDVLLAGLVLGLALGAKHTALITAIAVALLGGIMTFRNPENPSRLRKLVPVLAILVLAWVTLWGLYRFRFEESPQGRDFFNRPLAVKIADLHSPAFRRALSLTADLHLMPRAYLWGLADILHVGVEGRASAIFFIDRIYLQRVPFYFFPVVLLVKLPLGLILLALAGTVLALRSGAKWAGSEPLLVAVLFAGLLLVVLMAGRSSYAGIRHALLVVPSIALLGATAVSIAWERKSLVLLAGLGITAAAAMFSAIPVLRPWEYYNEIVGGKDNAWHYFNDEGIDSVQRTKELASYYHQHLKPTGETPFIAYGESESEDERRGVYSLQEFWKDHPDKDDSNTVTGTFMLSASALAPDPFTDYGSLREAHVAERFGNLLIYRGTFNLPGPRARRLSYRAFEAEYSDKPNLALAEEYLLKSLAAAPYVYYRWIELGNLQARRGAREQAIHAYETARANATPGDEIIGLLTNQIQRIAKEDPKSVPALRNPVLE
jgi:hypothetical protein